MNTETYEVFTLDDVEDTDCSEVVNENVLTLEDTDAAVKSLIGGSTDLGAVSDVIECDSAVQDVDMYTLSEDFGAVIDCSDDTAAIVTDDTLTAALAENVMAHGDIVQSTGIAAEITELESDDSETDNVVVEGLCVDIVDTVLEDTTTDITDDSVIEVEQDNTVVYRQGMTIMEFLRENPKIRTKEEVCKYFTVENVNRAIHNGAIMCMHNKLYL